MFPDRPQGPDRREIRAAFLAGFLLVALSLAALSPLLTADFIGFDDPTYVTQNLRVQAGVTWETIRWAFTTTYFGFYYPITWLSHALDCQLFGLWGGGHHLTSLLIHSANALLLFALFRTSTGAHWPSFFVAALFAVHPLHVESVAWISERKDVLSTLFLFLALLAYVRFARRPGLGRYLIVALCFLLGLMAKSMIVTAPVLMLIFDYWPLGRLRLSGRKEAPQEAVERPGGACSGERLTRWGLLLEKAPLLSLSLLFTGVTLVAQQGQGAVNSLTVLPLWTRLLNAVLSYAGYLAKMAVPVNMAIFYPYSRSEMTILKALPSALLLLLVTTLCWRFRFKRPYMLAGWLWYLCALVPVIGILQVGSQSSADRYTYVASIGIFMGTVWAAASLAGKSSLGRILVPAAGGVLLVVYSVLAFAQARTWQDSQSVFGHALRVTRNNYLAHTLLGLALKEKGDMRGALNHCKEAVRLAPNFPMVWGNLGNLLLEGGRLKEAEDCYQSVIKLDPKDWRSYKNLGLASELQGDLKGAESQFRKALELAPLDDEILVNLGRVLDKQGEVIEARTRLTQATVISPKSTRAWYYLGVMDEKEGALADAEKHLLKAVAVDPQVAEVQIKLARVLERSGRPDEAGAYYRAAFLLEPGNAEARDGMVRTGGAQ
jgi:Flp pilus assembly protein TadD